MQNPCDELQHLAEQMPVYTSWSIAELETLIARFREIILEMSQSEEYGAYKWLADICPDLNRRMQEMFLEKEPIKQSIYFDSIIFELRYAIKIITEGIPCTEDEWSAMLADRGAKQNWS